MQFTSYEFILFFLPITILLYFVANKIGNLWGKCVIIAASILFYSWGRPNLLLYLGSSILINYTMGLLVRREHSPKAIIVSSVIINVALLFYFKYLNFSISSINSLLGYHIRLQDIILPLGISFYTFQQISYIIETANGNLEGCGIMDYLAYILFFPKLVMGPITDPVDLISQLNDASNKRFNPTNLACGIKLFSYGLIKKALLADTFARSVTWVYYNLNTATAMDSFLSLIFYSFEIYFDFSGYSDMAIGISMMLNIELPINFDSPYKAVSIRDFWKRWHISLTRFLTRYIYIPLGGSRKGTLMTYINTMIVFIISGIWHGANWTFMLWGILHGFLSCMDRLLDNAEEKVFKPIRWFCTFIIVSVLWSLFSAESILQWATLLSKVFSMRDICISDGLIASFYVPESQLLHDLPGFSLMFDRFKGFDMAGFIIAACVILFIPANNYANRKKLGIGSLILSSLVFIWGVLCLGAETTFIYSGF